jgi:hypothetical protein
MLRIQPFDTFHFGTAADPDTLHFDLRIRIGSSCKKLKVHIFLTCRLLVLVLVYFHTVLGRILKEFYWVNLRKPNIPRWKVGTESVSTGKFPDPEAKKLYRSDQDPQHRTVINIDMACFPFSG